MANEYTAMLFSTLTLLTSWRVGFLDPLRADSPNFSTPKALEALIRQNFPPPKFSHVRYYQR